MNAFIIANITGGHLMGLIVCAGAAVVSSIIAGFSIYWLLGNNESKSSAMLVLPVMVIAWFASSAGVLYYS